MPCSLKEASLFTPQQLLGLNPVRIPRHIAIIPDGNRRWAKKQQENSNHGHQAGADVLIEMVKAAKQLGVKVITFYLFSTENWNRPNEEVAALMWLLKEFLNEQRAEMVEEGVRLKTIGDLTALSQDVLDVVDQTKQATEHCRDIDMVLALNYGGRDELTRAFQKIMDDCKSGKLQQDQITESLIGRYLDTADMGEPDLLIRTSGEMRLSNFLLWQLSYSEIYITEVLWPDFTPNNLLEAVIEYQKRERRLGGK